jgi:Uma2 family endonuclease
MSTPLNPPTRRIGPGRTFPPFGPDGLPNLFGDDNPLPCTIGPDGLPDFAEDEGEGDMGETSQHTDATDILFYGVQAHLAGRPEFDVRANLNVYYRPLPNWRDYFSPDVMVTRPPRPLPADLRWYRIGEHGPAPVLAAEVLSRRSFQQQDLDVKPVLYRQLGVAEYLLIDVTGAFLPQRLVLRRPDGATDWADYQDVDGGITSALGFRVVLDADGQIRVVDAVTGERYPRPREALLQVRAEADARRAAEERLREVEAELARLKAARTPRRGKKK